MNQKMKIIETPDNGIKINLNLSLLTNRKLSEGIIPIMRNAEIIIGMPYKSKLR
ncbi:MAG: hypothetical protein ACREAK_11005 [Nitrosarchaeum sp.]